MILKRMLGIPLKKKNRILEKHNINVDRQSENIYNCNIIAKIVQLFIKKTQKRNQKINTKSDQSSSNIISSKIFGIKSGHSANKLF